MFIVTLQAIIIFAVLALIVRFVFKAVRGDYDRVDPIHSMEVELRRAFS